MLRKPLTASLIALVAAGPYLTIPAFADASIVFYRGSEHAFVQPAQETGTGTPPTGTPASENPSAALNVVVSKPGTVAYGASFEMKFDAAGGKGAANWSTVYKGPRDARMTIVESSGGVVVTGRLPGGSYGPFWVTVSDGTTTVDSEKVTLLVGASPAVAAFDGGAASSTTTAGAAWNFLVKATGGIAPYTFSPTTFTGKLAGITGTPEAGGFRLTGTPASPSTVNVPIVVTDALGGVTPTTLQVVVPEPALQVAGLPTTVTSPFSFTKTLSTDTDAFALYDGSNSSYTMASSTAFVELNFAQAVSFSKITYGTEYPGTVDVFENNAWVPVKLTGGSTTFTNTTGNTVTLDRTYSGQKVRFKGNFNAYKLYEFRIGGGLPSVRPTLAGAYERTLQSDNTFITYDDFNDLSPYSSRVSFLQTVATQGSVQLLVDKDSIKLASRPTTDQTVTIVATSEDGARDSFIMTIMADRAGDPTSIVPSTFSSPNTVTKTVSTDTDVFAIYDGSNSSYAKASNTSFVELNYTNPVSFSKITYGTEYPGTVEVYDNDAWRQVKLTGGAPTFNATTGATVNLDRVYTASKIRFKGNFNLYSLYEFRIGGGTPSLRPTLIGSLQRPLLADNKLVTYSDFNDPSPYSTRVSFLQTATTQDGLQLIVTKDSVSLASRPTTDQTVTIVATSEDGARESFTMVILADTGLPAATTPPASVSAPGGITKNVASDTDIFALYDGSTNSYARASNTAFVDLNFTNPVSFSKIVYGTEYPGTVEVYDNNAWRPVKLTGGATTFTNGNNITATLDRVYTAKQIRFKGNFNPYALNEFRIGGGAPLTR